ALFFSGRRHAGENLAQVLRHRAETLPPPIQMCDALSRNLPGELRTIVAHCLAHAPNQLVAATYQTIADATAFDERDINQNFAYDYEAYGEVKRNLGRLIDAGQLQQAMRLTLELMKQGSYQV